MMDLPRNLVKDGIALILFYLSAYLFGDPLLFALCDPCGCPHSLGYPLHFGQDKAIGASFDRNSFSCGTQYMEFNFPYLIADLLFWYLLVYLADYSIGLLRQKKKR
jgi:hypothetical protein